MLILLEDIRVLFFAWLRCSLFIGLTLLVGMPGATLAQADDLAACVKRKVTFDGTVPLHYAIVKAGPRSRLDLDPDYSNHCEHSSCVGIPYLVSGDAVAIGKMCGSRDYVQYIGKTRISEGWVDSVALSPIEPPPPPEPPVIKIGKEVLPTPTPQHYKFTLTKGAGVPVCEAYQQRLNQTEFYAPPYCGRPESTLVPGFAELRRRYLTAAEYGAMYSPAQAVLNHEPLEWAEKHQTNSDGSVTYVPIDPVYPGFTPGAWTYDLPISIDNASDTNNVIMWTPQDRYDWSCGSQGDVLGGYMRGGALGLVVSADGKKINREASYAVFGQENLSPNVHGLGAEFSDEFGIFRYKELNYFDAMFNPAVFDYKKRNVLDVFLFVGHHRQEMCEYNVSGLEE